MKRYEKIGGLDLTRFGRAYRLNYVGALHDLRRQHGDTIYLNWPARVWMFFAPDDVQEILQKKNKSFVKDPDLKSHANRGVIFSGGTDWQQQRKGLSPIFRESILRNFVTSTILDVNDLFDSWQQFAGVGSTYQQAKTFDAYHEINKLFLRLSCKTLFGYDVRDDEEAYIHAFRKNCENIVAKYTAPPFSINNLIPAPFKKQTGSERCVLGIADKMIENNEGPSEANFSVISHLMDDVPSQQSKPREQLREEVSSLLNASFASTSVTIAWALYLIGNHPNSKVALLQELAEFKNQESPTLEGFSKLNFAGQILNETMRLYPAIPVLKVRRASRAESINGCFVRRGERVAVSPFVTHRDPIHWEEPEQFVPQRFSAENQSLHHPFAFFPFGDGPRSCPGNHLALLNMKIVLAVFLQRFDFELDKSAAVEPLSHIVCRPDPGVFMKIRNRNDCEFQKTSVSDSNSSEIKHVPE